MPQPRMDDGSFSAVPNHLKADAYSFLTCFVLYISFLNQYVPYTLVPTTFPPKKGLLMGKEKRERDTLLILDFRSLFSRI